MLEQIEQSKKDLGNNTELQKTTYKAADDDIYDADGDGEESVSEYIEKKKIATDAKGEEEEKALASKKNKSKEDLEKMKDAVGRVGNAIGNVSSVVSAVPKFAAFGLGAGTSALAKLIADELKNNK